MANKLFRQNSAWNRLGPYVPLWFRKQLQRIDPSWVLQFIPPRCRQYPRGVDPTMHRHGVWMICVKLKRTGLLSSRCIWSLTDEVGNFAPPSNDTLTLLRMAQGYHKRGRSDLLDKALDDSLQECNYARQEKSRNRLRSAMKSFVSSMGQRQWTNRVFIRAQSDKVAV